MRVKSSRLRTLACHNDTFDCIPSAGAIPPVSLTNGDWNVDSTKFNCYFPDQIGSMQLHEPKFTQCAFPRETLKPVLLIVRATERVGEFVRWYNSFAGLSEKRTKFVVASVSKLRFP